MKNIFIDEKRIVTILLSLSSVERKWILYIKVHPCVHMCRCKKRFSLPFKELIIIIIPPSLFTSIEIGWVGRGFLKVMSESVSNLSAFCYPFFLFLPLSTLSFHLNVLSFDKFFREITFLSSSSSSCSKNDRLSQSFPQLFNKIVSMLLILMYR